MSLDILVYGPKNKINPIVRNINLNFVCEIRSCEEVVEVRRKMKERIANVLIVFLDKKEDYINFIKKHLVQIISLNSELEIILCGSGVLEEKSLISIIPGKERVYLFETCFFEEKYIFIIQYFFYKKQANQKIDYNFLFTKSLIGSSKIFRSFQNQILQIAKNKTNLMLSGDKGLEYNSIAHMIHKNSKRREFDFIICDLCLYEKDLIEKELFGFFDKISKFNKGVFERVNGGTVFLKNIHLLSKKLQDKLLLFVRNSCFQRTNSKVKTVLDVRLISYIPKMILESKEFNISFDQELLKRISIEKLYVPCLRERVDDIGELCDFLFEKICCDFGYRKKILSDKIKLKLSCLEWKYNIEELYNFLACIFVNDLDNDGDTVESFVDKMTFSEYSTDSLDIYAKDLKSAKLVFEKDYILTQVKRFGGNITKAAKFMGVNRVVLHRKLKSIK